MIQIRAPAVAGTFYPNDQRALRELLHDCFYTSTLGPRGSLPVDRRILGGIVPHAGPVYSGPCAAHFFAALSTDIEQVIVLGVNHRGRGHAAALGSWDAWRTPLGEVPVNQDAGKQLASTVDFLRRDNHAHEFEHSIEIELLFLQQVLEHFCIVPISLAQLSTEQCLSLGRAIGAFIANNATARTIVIASSDLSHYLSPAETAQLDRAALAAVLELNGERLLQVVNRQNISMCGALPAATLLHAAAFLHAPSARLLQHYHSGDVKPMDEVVGYASVAIDRSN